MRNAGGDFYLEVVRRAGLSGFPMPAFSSSDTPPFLLASIVNMITLNVITTHLIATMAHSESSSRPRQQGIQSIETGALLLAALAESTRGLALGELAAAAGMPSAKAHRYLVSFVRMGLVEQHPFSGHYDLGPFALRLGLTALGRIDPVRLATPVIESLASQLGVTAALAIWGEAGPTIVRWIDSPRPVVVNLRTGGIMPLTHSATGLVFSAWLPRELTQLRIREELEAAKIAQAPGRPCTYEALEARLATVRAEGVSRIAGELMLGIDALAAPVFDAHGKLALVLTLVGTAHGFDASKQGRAASILKDAARDLSQRCGYSI